MGTKGASVLTFIFHQKYFQDHRREGRGLIGANGPNRALSVANIVFANV